MRSLLLRSSLWGLLLCFLSVSCKSASSLPPQVQTTTTQRDSISSRQIPIDTQLIAREKESVSLSEVLDKLSSTPLVRSSGGARLSVSRDGEQLQATCECEELKVALTLYKEIVEYYRDRQTLTETTHTVVDTQIPGWAKPFLYLGIILTLGMFIMAFLYIRKLPGKLI